MLLDDNGEVAKSRKLTLASIKIRVVSFECTGAPNPNLRLSPSWVPMKQLSKCDGGCSKSATHRLHEAKSSELYTNSCGSLMVLWFY